ncbi:glycosyltransferase [Paraburkholderia dipogonis]|uniref:Glycosyltransferase n=1 Tax=Paraburkholderia dipogonis TaxID=1211383 RepID=A0ABW9B2A4_9BURK
MKISVVVPCYNAVDKIGRCLDSIRAIDFSKAEYEVIFVDDCSTDGTYELLEEVCTEMPNWRLLRLEANSGSPSRPRNRGIDAASGDYVYFLDCDDEILPAALKDQYELAHRTGATLIRSELWAEDGRNRRLMNQLNEWSLELSISERRELIIGKQSTVVASFIKIDLLRRNQIRWPEHLRMGEDTVFLATVLLHSDSIEYLPRPTFVYYKLPSLTPASTQRYGRRELRDHLEVWATTQELLRRVGINYLRSRLHVGLRVSLEAQIFRNRGDLDAEVFNKFHEFVVENWEIIKNFRYTERLKELLSATRNGKFNEFKLLCRPRLLIAGHDLKFVSDAIPELSSAFDIRIDEWKGHAIHDESESLRHLEWAELIWCEWLLKNVEWYSNHKRSNQRLIVRMHRMELGRHFGERVNVANVDAFVTVSVLFFERLIERFPDIPRHKVRLVDNYVRTSGYRESSHEDRLFTLGMIGILPARKGLLRVLNILSDLRKQDKRYRLEIFGHNPEDVPWVFRNREEMAYFNACAAFIESNELASAVAFNGHQDVKSELAARNVGYVISASDSEFGFPGPESFHVALADAFSAGGIGIVRHWGGSEYIWPAQFIVESDDDIVERIAHLNGDDETRCWLTSEGKNFVEKNYGVAKFATTVKDLFQEIF